MPSIKRRTFLRTVFGGSAAALVWPRRASAQPPAPRYDGLTYSDNSGHTTFTALNDDTPATGIEYQP